MFTLDYRMFLGGSTQLALDRLAAEQDVRGSTDAGALNLIAALVLASGAKNVLQLGTYLGWSALVLADLVGPKGQVVTVDPDWGFLQIANHYSDLAGLHNLTYVVGFSHHDKVVAEVARTPWDAIYIDTTHHYAQTVAELEIYCGRVAGPGTLVLLHDASTHAQSLDVEGKGGVKAAITEWLAAHPDWQGMIYEPPAFPAALFGLGVLTRRT